MRPKDFNRSVSPWIYRPESHKTEHHGKERLIFIGPRVKPSCSPICSANLRATVFRRPRRNAAASCDCEARKTPVQPSQKNRRKKRPKRTPGTRYTKDSYRCAVHAACDAADRQARTDAPEIPSETRLVPRWSPNRLRHVAATEIRKRFGSIEVPQVVLGHSSANITQVYAERDHALAAQIMREIG